MTQYIETRQECGHERLWRSNAAAPKLGERIYCPQCQDMRAVDVIPGSWLAICDDCKWKQRRIHLETIHKLIVNHLYAHPGHVICLADYSREQAWTIQDQVWIQDGHHSASVVTDMATMRQQEPLWGE